MASSPQHEPTMEEILASIRKIISEDSTDTPAAPVVAAAAPPLEADVLDLTHEVHDEPAPEPVAEGPAAAPPPPAPVIAASAPPAPAAAPEEPEPAVIENDVVFQTIEEESPVSEAQATVAPHEGIFSDKTRKALEDSFASIPDQRPAPVAAAEPEPAAVPAPAADGSSVQDVFEKAVRDSFEPVLHKWLGEHSDDVVDKLKPLVRQWMDDHFPALLEGAVRAEVERVARARH